ncbi:MAG: 6-phosphofructokinase [Fimbriimonadaceae bacterium]
MTRRIPNERVFVVEVMGRRNGFIALEVALSSGAEAVLIPEVPFSLLEICDNLKKHEHAANRSSGFNRGCRGCWSRQRRPRLCCQKHRL